MNRTPLYQRFLLHGSMVLLALSGVAWAIMKHLLEPMDEFSAVGHPLQPWAVAAHVAAAPAAVFATGLIFREHIAGRLSEPGMRAGRRSGTVATTLIGLLAVSGVALQVVTNETARPLLGWTHLAVGALFTGFYLAHWVAARRALRILPTGPASRIEAVASVAPLPRSRRDGVSAGEASRG